MLDQPGPNRAPDDSPEGRARQPDPERIAALIDGRLNAAERAALLAEIDLADEAFDVLVDATAAVASLEPGAVGKQPHVPAGRRRGWAKNPRTWLALAAGIAGIAFVPWTWARLRNDASDPGRFATTVNTSDTRLAAFTEARPWSRTRGAVGPLATGSRAARIGAYVTDVELALKLRATGSSRAAALSTGLLDELIGLLDQTHLGGAAAVAYREIRDHPGDVNAGRLADARKAAGLADPVMVDVGAWTEAALIAASEHDPAFFSRWGTTALLQGVGSRHVSDSSRALMTAVRAKIRTSPPTDWERLAPDPRWATLAQDLREVLRGLTE